MSRGQSWERDEDRNRRSRERSHDRARRKRTAKRQQINLTDYVNVKTPLEVLEERNSIKKNVGAKESRISRTRA